MDWLSEAKQLLALPNPQTAEQTELRMRQLKIIVEKLVRELEEAKSA
jgi:hypothetical protein